MCPHANIVHCPLYIAMHVANAPSCITRDLENGCAVEQGKRKYASIVAVLSRFWPGIIDRCADEESAALKRDQMARNMRAAGLH